MTIDGNSARKLIRAIEGAELDFAVEAKSLLMKTPDGVRKLKLIRKLDARP